MKFLTFAVVFSLCSSLSAQDGEMLGKAKEHQLSNIDKRISSLNELKVCISGAANKEAMQACRATHKTQMKALKDANESFSKQMKSSRIYSKKKKIKTSL